MKRILFAAVIATALFGSKLLTAQDITGTWQGTLQAGKSLRTVVKFERAGAEWKGNFYSIDQGGRPFALTKIVAQSGSVQFSIIAIGGDYKGTVAQDAKTITGNWTQGGASLPLVLTKVTPDTAWAIPEVPKAVPPMAADANPSFEVATIKPSKPDQPGKYFSVRGNRFTTFNTTLADMLSFAYGIHAKQLVGAPAWVDTDKFDIAAQPDKEGSPSDKQWKNMMAKLIAERFAFKYHHDQKELSVYAITVAKGGPKLTPAQGNDSGLPGNFFRNLGQMTNINSTLGDFARTMQAAVLDRPVVDQTGLTNRFDFTLNWTPDESQFGGMGVKVPPPSDKADAPPGLFTAIQEQLGLKLDAAKAPVDVFVVDHVDKPSEN